MNYVKRLRTQWKVIWFFVNEKVFQNIRLVALESFNNRDEVCKNNSRNMDSRC